MNNIASLAKLNISEAEKEIFIRHLENVLDYVEILKEVDIDNEALVYNIEDEAAVLRNDEIKASFDREDILKNATSTKDGYFIIPNNLK